MGDTSGAGMGLALSSPLDFGDDGAKFDRNPFETEETGVQFSGEGGKRVMFFLGGGISAFSFSYGSRSLANLFPPNRAKIKTPVATTAPSLAYHPPRDCFRVTFSTAWSASSHRSTPVAFICPVGRVHESCHEKNIFYDC